MLQIDTTGMQRTHKPAVAMAIKQLLWEFPVHPGTAMHVGKSLFCRAAWHLRVIDGSAAWLTHCTLNKIADTLQTFSIAFYGMTSFIFWFKFHWNLLRRFRLTISQHWFKRGLGAVQATSHYLNHCWLRTLTSYGSHLATPSHYQKRHLSHLPQKLVRKTSYGAVAVCVIPLADQTPGR